MILEIPFHHLAETVRRRRRTPEVFRIRDFASVDVPTFRATDLERADVDVRISIFGSATEFGATGWRVDGRIHLPVAPEREARIVVEGSRLRTSFEGPGYSVAVRESSDLLIDKVFAGGRAHDAPRSIAREDADEMEFSRILRSDRDERAAATASSAERMILVDGILHSSFVEPVVSPTWGSVLLADRRLAFDTNPMSTVEADTLFRLGSIGICPHASMIEDRSGFDLSECTYPDVERELVLLARTLVPNLMRTFVCEEQIVGLLEMERRLCEGSADRRDLPEFAALLDGILPELRRKAGSHPEHEQMFAAPIRSFLSTRVGNVPTDLRPA